MYFNSIQFNNSADSWGCSDLQVILFRLTESGVTTELIMFQLIINSQVRGFVYLINVSL